MELSSVEIQTILKRFPQFEGSYETILHKNLSKQIHTDKYDVAIAIPYGRKFYLWYSWYQDNNVCFAMELNRDKKIIRISIKETDVSLSLALGTLFYVSFCNDCFFLEDIYYYKGVAVYKQTYGKKLGCMEDFLSSQSQPSLIYLPDIWDSRDPVPSFKYPIHHIQYRSLTNICPYLNESQTTIIKEKEIVVKEAPVWKESFHNYKKPQYKMPTVFIVSADIKFDIYHLWACGKKMTNEYYGVAYIPSYQSSIFMNGLFRNIRENRNLDYIEESDDEDDFENTKDDKYVDLNKRIKMECVFHPKFRRWIPMRVVGKERLIVHVNKL